MVKRKVSRARWRDLDETWFRHHLATGRGMHIFRSDRPDPPTAEELDTAWEQWGESIVAEFVHEHPGHRPWYWWKTEAPEERRALGGDFTYLRDYPHAPPNLEEKTSFGIPAIGRLVWADPPVHESEEDYLRRLDLLTAEEQQALSDDGDVYGPELVEV